MLLNKTTQIGNGLMFNMLIFAYTNKLESPARLQDNCPTVKWAPNKHKAPSSVNASYQIGSLANREGKHFENDFGLETFHRCRWDQTHLNRTYNECDVLEVVNVL